MPFSVFSRLFRSLEGFENNKPFSIYAKCTNIGHVLACADFSFRHWEILFHTWQCANHSYLFFQSEQIK